MKFLRQIKTTCYDQILSVYLQEKRKPARRRRLITFVTDGFENYRKDRTKTMRDFGSHEGAETFLDMKRTIHNFVNLHMELKGITPAEAAEVDLKLGRRKLLNLIRYVAQRVPRR